MNRINPSRLEVPLSSNGLNLRANTGCRVPEARHLGEGIRCCYPLEPQVLERLLHRTT